MHIEKHNPKIIPLTQYGWISRRSVLLKIKKNHGYPTISEGHYDEFFEEWHIVGIGVIPHKLIKWWTEIPEDMK